jgi:bile acid-coenzyme A ligase
MAAPRHDGPAVSGRGVRSCPTMATVSYAAHLRSHADARPDAPALTVVAGRTRSWRDLVDDATRTARILADLGVAPGDLVTIAYPNNEAFVITTMACWFVGAVPQPVSSKLPGRELDEIVALADSRVVAGVDADRAPGRATLPPDFAPDPSIDASPLPDAVSPSWKAPTSGGSTGRPKLILAGTPSTVDTDAGPSFTTAGGTIVVPGPLYHNGPFVWAAEQLRNGGHLVLLPRFDPAETLRAVEEHSAETLYLVPTMMQRIWKLDPAVRDAFDLSSLTRIWHLAAPCPAWLKEEWIRWMGPERIIELYAGTEAQSATVITGAEWLEHRGSVGRPIAGEMKIVRADGSDADPGEPGEVFMRPPEGTVTYRYVGAEPTATEGGWESLGDMGWMDEEGYLYLGDRKKDMILSGGANIYPAEVEAAIDRHPDVVSCAVIGLPDDDLGERIHAIVQGNGSLDLEDLRRHLAEEIVRYKIPRTFELVDEPVRDDAGKVRRSSLAAERS